MGKDCNPGVGLHPWPDPPAGSRAVSSTWWRVPAGLPRSFAEPGLPWAAALLLVLSLLITLGQWWTVSVEEEAVAVAESLHEELRAVTGIEPGLDFAARLERFRPIVQSYFDVPVICSAVLGRHWKELEPRQRRQFIHAYSRLLAGGYAARFSQRVAERFRAGRVRVLSPDRMLVESTSLLSNGRRVAWDYLLFLHAGKWYIMDASTHGRNGFSLRRAEYSSIIEKQGFDALLQYVDHQIHHLRAA